MSFLFENLKVYQKAVSVCKHISILTDTFPRGNYYLTDQLNRAALSIPANIAEGNGRWHANDKKQFFYIARGSTHECIPIIEVCLEKKLIDQKAYQEIKTSFEEISKMISGLIKGIGINKK